MKNHIVSVNLDIQDGLLQGIMYFDTGLNILAGENGTFKTKIMQHLQQKNILNLHDSSVDIRIQAINPKRNSQRRQFKAIVEEFRSQNKNKKTFMQSRNLDDASIEPYPSLGELYLATYEDYRRGGGDQKTIMRKVTREFNSVFKKIFDDYKISASWEEDPVGMPAIQIIKQNGVKFPIEGLSLGEQEVLSLVMYLYSSIEEYDVFLIDEPEAHLNWHLEEKLFDLFTYLCDKFSTQIILTTHSRVVFKSDYLPKTQFLTWNEDGKIEWSKEINAKDRERIAGDTADLIRMGDPATTTFWVEDYHHVIIMNEIRDILGVEAAVIECDNKGNVRAIYKRMLRDNNLTNAYFIEDGDNEGSPYENESHFIHLKKYCFENYLFDFSIVSKVCSKPEDQIIQDIFNSIQDNRYNLFKNHKSLDFLLEALTVEIITPDNIAKIDASDFIDSFLTKVGMEFPEYVKMYVQECHSQNKLRNVFPPTLIDILETH